MSVPSHQGRLSTPSMSSPASSPTLHSNHSEQYHDNGEGSSSHRPSLAGSRHNSGTRESARDQSQSSGSTLSVEAIGSRDFALRRPKTRRPGGFLLDSTFSSGPKDRHIQHGGHAVVAKERKSLHKKNGHDRHEHGGNEHTSGGVGISMVAREAITSDMGAPEAERNDSVNLEQNGPRGIQFANVSAGPQNMASTAYGMEQQPPSGTSNIAFDPNQIVHMALNLSESRRRHMSAGHLLSQQVRASSGSQREGSHHSPGTGSGHLRQYMNEQRRISRNISPFGDKGSPAPGRHVGSPRPRRGSIFTQVQQHTPTDASLRRADKFREFIELRVEYLRLLECLPPLKPDASAPGNFVVSANNVPGSPLAQLTRMPSYRNSQHSLGRPYNPLQFLRNRRSRARERRSYDHQPEEFTDVQQVREWVDQVEEAVESFSYRQADGVTLPKYHEDHAGESVPPKPPRPTKVWMFTMEELFADAHWLEHGDHKTIIEDRHGRRIFPQKEPQKQDHLQLRPSKEYPEKRRKSWVEGLAGAADNHNTTGDESEAISERGRKRRILPTFRAGSPKHKAHLWSDSKQAVNHTDTSDSENESHRWRSRKGHKTVEADNDTGPLALRMKQLMEREAAEAQTTQTINTPLINTPDTPNKWGQNPVEPQHEELPRGSFEVPSSANGSVKAPFDLGLTNLPKQRVISDLSQDPSKASRSSLDGFDSTAPSSPIHERHFPYVDGDQSPSLSRAGSERKKPKKSKFDFLRSDDGKANKHERNLRPGSAGSDGKRHSMEDIDEGSGIASVIWAAPGAVKNLIGHRKNDSVNSLASPKDSKESPSAVTRFIKGVKNEGSKVGEFIFRKDRPTDESEAELADTQSDSEVDNSKLKNKSNLARSTTAETMSSMTPKKSNNSYHLELPSFRSSTAKADEDTDSQLSDHPITRQARENARNRSSRFDKLAPPRMDLSRISTATSSRSSSQDRITQLLARPGGVGHAGLPVTALTKETTVSNSSDNQHSASRPTRPTLEGKRHWSITDDNTSGTFHRTNSHPSIVTGADIASVRALFLCSGIKAKEINRRALEIRTTPPSFLTRAARSAGADLYAVSRKEEHVLAARILVTSFEKSTEALQALTNDFREVQVARLMNRIDGLKRSLDAELFTRVRDSGDDAVRVTSWVSADGPLRVKQITDDIEHMLRMRRRRTRWMRRAGWTVLEWMLLGFMWCAWLVVTLVRVVARVVGVGWTVVRWLLWL